MKKVLQKITNNYQATHHKARNKAQQDIHRNRVLSGASQLLTIARSKLHKPFTYSAAERYRDFGHNDADANMVINEILVLEQRGYFIQDPDGKKYVKYNTYRVKPSVQREFKRQDRKEMIANRKSRKKNIPCHCDTGDKLADMRAIHKWRKAQLDKKMAKHNANKSLKSAKARIAMKIFYENKLEILLDKWKYGIDPSIIV